MIGMVGSVDRKAHTHRWRSPIGSNLIWHNDIIIHMAQLIGFFLYQQPMSLLLNIQIHG